MKNRRIAITSFLLLAVLVMGIGFAAVADTLNITGTATFRPTNVVNDRVDAAIKFSGAEADGIYCTAASYSADSADMTVLINDAGERDEFNAVATYKVIYDTTDTTYPAVEISVEDSISKALGSDVAIDGFSLNVAYEYAANAAVEGKLSPGEEMTVTVTVSYNTANAPDLAEVSLASIAIALHYSTEDLAVTLPID